MVFLLRRKSTPFFLLLKEWTVHRQSELSNIIILSIKWLIEAALGSFLIKIMTENSSALKMINPRRKFSPFCVRRVIEKAQSGGILIFFTPEKDCGGSQSVKI